MPRSACRIREGDVVRVIRAALKAGLRVSGIVCWPDGRIEIRHSDNPDAAHWDPSNENDLVSMVKEKCGGKKNQT